MTVGLATVVAAFAGPTAASAAAPGLTFVPFTGLASSPMFVVAPEPCPVQASNVVAIAYGKGFPAGGQTVVTNSTAGISHDKPFVMPLQDTFLGFAADNGITLSGPYRVTLSCSDRLRRTSFRSWSGTVTFADASHYSAPAPSSALFAQVNGTPRSNTASAPGTAAKPGAVPKGEGDASAQAQNGGPSSRAGSPGVAGSSSAAPGSSAGAPVNASPTAAVTKDDSPSFVPWLVGGAVLLLLLGLALRRRERHALGTRAIPVHRSPVREPRTPSSTAPVKKVNEERRAVDVGRSGSRSR